MKLSDFDFELPKELIAQFPATPRDHAKLLVYRRDTKEIIDDHFYNLEKYLNPETTLVVNNSKVEKCRMRFGKLEIFVIETVNPNTIRALVRPGKVFSVGKVKQIELADSLLEVETIQQDSEGIRTLKLNMSIDDPRLNSYKLTPLPPYIRQDESLASEYQTVYADPLGSKAAPTAGLHFTPHQLLEISKSHQISELTLHVGLGTFAPVKTDDINDHKLHFETYEISQETADTLNNSSHITAVGTTSARTLESLERPFKKISGQTDIYIRPGYHFKNVDSLITNFHLPKSTLLMMVSALMGSVDEMQRVYDHAIKHQYRFYSFGDAMIII